MPLYKASFETLFVRRDPTAMGSVGQTYGRKHDIILEADSLKAAAEDALRFVRNRQDGEASFAKMRSEDPDLDPDSTYETYWGDLGAMKVWGWSPHIVKEDGNLADAKGYAGRGMFEWKCDFPFPIEKCISIIKD